MNIPKEEQIKDPCEKMVRLAQGYLPLEKWMFNESYRSKKDERLIYDSEWCRVKFVWSGWEIYTGNTISIYYGRAHAPSEKIRMNWNGAESLCWHGLWGGGEIPNFLDGLTPQEASVQKGWPHILAQFSRSELGKSLEKKRRNQPEQMILTHAAIWENYGQVLFELFDLRRPDLWEQYRKFLKEYYDIKGRSPNIKPSLDQVC